MISFLDPPRVPDTGTDITLGFLSDAVPWPGKPTKVCHKTSILFIRAHARFNIHGNCNVLHELAFVGY